MPGGIGSGTFTLANVVQVVRREFDWANHVEVYYRKRFPGMKYVYIKVYGDNGKGVGWFRRWRL